MGIFAPLRRNIAKNIRRLAQEVLCPVADLPYIRPVAHRIESRFQTFVLGSDRYAFSAVLFPHLARFPPEQVPAIDVESFPELRHRTDVVDQFASVIYVEWM